MQPNLKMKLGIEGDPVRLWQMVRASDEIAVIDGSDWIEWLGEYPDLKKTHLEILNLLARILSMLYPDRADQRISICQASSRTGYAPNAPTHSGTTSCSILDLHYFTKGWPTNHTQNGDSPAPLYNDDGSIGDYFDAERNTLFVRYLREIYPQARVLAGTTIKNAMLKQAGAFWPPDLSVPSMFRKDEARFIDLAIQADDNPVLCHDTHMHVDFGGPINWDATL